MDYLRRRRNGFTLIEVLLALSIFTLTIFIIVKLYSDVRKSIFKTQELTNLQQIAKSTLSEMSREIRQTVGIRDTETGDIVADTNFTLAPDGTNQLCMFVPKILRPDDLQIADSIMYKIDTYRGNANRLLQQLTTFTRDINGNVIVEQVYPWIPILVSIDKYRKESGSDFSDSLLGVYNNRLYNYDNVTFFWDENRGTVAMGITVSVTDARGRLQNRLSMTTVITSRGI